MGFDHGHVGCWSFGPLGYGVSDVAFLATWLRLISLLVWLLMWRLMLGLFAIWHDF
jgi:hypothetical protein